MIFGWDPAKRLWTLSERGIDFASLALCFDDPSKLIWRDSRRDYGEMRYNMLAERDGRLLHVTFTIRDVVWVISARKANSREQRRYDGRRFQSDFDRWPAP